MGLTPPTTTSPEDPLVAGIWPNDEELLTGLSAVLPSPACRLVKREPNLYSSSFASELVTFTHARSEPERVFCKYGRDVSDGPHAAYGHRGGVPYEAKVYAKVLSALDPGPPKLRGIWSPDGNKTTWLFLEALDPSAFVKSTRLVLRAASWLGGFHATAALRAEQWRGDIRPYEEAYFHGWITRTRALGASRHLPWLDELCDQAAALTAPLLAAPPTVLHGEFFPHNVLSDPRGGIHPVDWESAAIGPGEIDLATLTDGWGPQVTAACSEAYCNARWPAGPPDGVQEWFLAAQLHVQFRWLGDQPEWTEGSQGRVRFPRLLSVANAGGFLR